MNLNTQIREDILKCMAHLPQVFNENLVISTLSPYFEIDQTCMEARFVVRFATEFINFLSNNGRDVPFLGKFFPFPFLGKW